MEDISTKENLKREIGTIALALAIINVVVGSGIFVIPAIIAEGLGAAAILAYLVCGLLLFLIGLCFAELGSKTAASGGAYTYIERAFGPYAGFIANNIFWLGGCVMADAAISNALVNTLKYFFPVLGEETMRILFLFVVFSILMLLNIRSVKNGVRFIEFTALGKLLPLVLLVIASIAFVEPENLKWVITPTIEGVGTASLLLFFAFIGMEVPLSSGGEIKNPKRTVPMGIFLGVSAILLLYISIQLVTQGILGDDMAAHKDAPLAAVANTVFGTSGSVFIIAVTALSMLGALAGQILSNPRILFAGARDRLMPKPLAKVHSKFFTPHIAIAVYSGLGFIFAVTGGFKQLATISSAAILIIYLGVALASIKLRTKQTDSDEKTFRMPGGFIIPILTAIGIIWLLSNLTQPELVGIVIFTLIFSVIYVVMKLMKKR